MLKIVLIMLIVGIICPKFFRLCAFCFNQLEKVALKLENFCEKPHGKLMEVFHKVFKSKKETKKVVKVVRTTK